MLTSCRRMFAPKRSSTPQSRHSRRDAAVDRQNMELPITLLADHPLQLGNFTSAHLGTFKSALTPNALPASDQPRFAAAVVSCANAPRRLQESPSRRRAHAGADKISHAVGTLLNRRQVAKPTTG